MYWCLVFCCWFVLVLWESARAHPPSTRTNQQQNTKHQYMFGVLLLVCLYYFTYLNTWFLLSMSSVLSSLMHYISFTFKQSLTALSNACTSAFNLFISFLFASTYSHRLWNTYSTFGFFVSLFLLRRCAHAHQASKNKETKKPPRTRYKVSCSGWFLCSLFHYSYSTSILFLIY